MRELNIKQRKIIKQNIYKYEMFNIYKMKQMFETYGKQRIFNQGILNKIGNFAIRKFHQINNQYVKTLSTKKLILVLVINGLLASPIIPGGILACPFVTNFMIR